ncbi:hypothetical protein EVAR_69926_1 [Eumeta japonica]|uniref:Uncharacterized protein n=1 Tax=Eumeta variegata TaxID=151549 RepID=A0A4C1T5L3_EUMVA|nr:hypothetical protein EVAR_69926_1 [Eumeta japonica]
MNITILYKVHEKHNTLLHLGITREVTPPTATKSYRQTQKSPTTCIKYSPIVAATNEQLIDPTCVLLAIARMKLVGTNGHSCIFRALLDSGSQTNKIDLLIGAEFYHQLMRPQQIKINQNLPILQTTTLGWIITDKLQENFKNLITCTVLASEEQATSQLIERF